jgi:cadmium resistance protein CadD (predicted permease)
MTTKAAIIATIVTFVATIVVSIILLVVFVNPRSARANERASQLGQGVGMACLLPLGGIWISWAARRRKQREQKK